MGFFDKRKKKYENGDEYIGKLKGGKPNGFGTMHYANGDVYEGEWADGVRSGHGKYENKYGDLNCFWETTYEGEWFNDEYSGQGIHRVYHKGYDSYIETYEGQWAHGKLNGKVKHKQKYFDSGTTYEFEGEFVDGSKEGYGVSRLSADHTEIYEGYWSKGKFCGQGTFTIHDQVATGIFDDYSRITNATIRYPNGDVYEGDVIMDNELQKGETCHGRMTYANGDVYEGQWLWTELYKGAPDGWGTLTPSGNYPGRTGSWKNGEQISFYESLGKSGSKNTSQYYSAPVSSASSESRPEPAEKAVTAGNEPTEAPKKSATATSNLPKMTIATVGAPGSGKTTLTAAISKVLSVRYNTEYKPVTVQELDNRPEEQRVQRSIDTSIIEYRTDARHYTHIDCPGRYFKNALCGIQMADACILVVSARDGILRETEDFMRLCGINTFVFLETSDQDDDEIVDLVRSEIEELVYKEITIGRAQEAIDNPYGPAGDAIMELMKLIEHEAPIRKRDTEGSLSLPIHKVYTFSEKGPIVLGRIESGTVRIGDTLELVGADHSVYTVTAKEIQYFGRDVESACAGDYVGILLEGTFPKKIKRGQILATPGTRPCYEHLKVKVWLDRKISFNNREPKTYNCGTDIQCWFGLTSSVGMVLSCEDPARVTSYPEYRDYMDSDYPNKNLRFIDLFFADSIPARKNAEVIFIEHNRRTGYGTVVEADNADPDAILLQFSGNDEPLLLENNRLAGFGRILGVENSEVLLCDNEKEREAALGQETAKKSNGLEKKNSMPSASEEQDKANDAEEQYNQGMRYIDDKGTQDYAKAVDCFRIAAEQGHVLAQFQLGECYRIGRGVEKDIPIALSWLEKAAQQGHAQAQNNYGFCHVLGRGVEKDYEKGFYWLEKAAAQGHAEAQNNLGYFYKFGVGVEKDYEKAIHWYELSARQGNAAAQYGLGRSYESEAGVAKDLEKAIYWYKQAAMQGFALAQNQLGICYSFYKNNYPEAFFWYKKAAEQGVDNSMYALGNYYYEGRGVEKDYEMAAYWYEKAYKAGIRSVKDKLEEVQRILENNLGQEELYNRGRKYFYGESVEKDYERAFQLYYKAAEMGHAPSQCAVADCYRFGFGVKKNEAEAIHWYESSAMQGYAEAQYELGDCYELGFCVQKDPKKAFYWFEKSAQQGNEDAQFRMALHYVYSHEDGEEEKAVYWLEKSAANGNGIALYHLAKRYLQGKGVIKDRDKGYALMKQAAEAGSDDAKVFLDMRELAKKKQ